MEEPSLYSLRFEPYGLIFLQFIRFRLGFVLLLLESSFIFCSFAPAQGESPGPEDGGWVSTWGAPVLSDPVDFEVRPLMTLAISLYITRETGTAVIHPLGNQPAYLSQSGDQSGATAIADVATVTERYFLTRIEVSSPNNAGAIVALGDSITDGRGSSQRCRRPRDGRFR